MGRNRALRSCYFYVSAKQRLVAERSEISAWTLGNGHTQDKEEAASDNEGWGKLLLSSEAEQSLTKMRQKLSKGL